VFTDSVTFTFCVSPQEITGFNRKTFKLLSKEFSFFQTPGWLGAALYFISVCL